MTTYSSLAFAAMAVFLVLIPSPLHLLATCFTLQRGRRTAVAVISGLALGFCAALAIAMVPVGLVAYFWPAGIGMVAFLGPWYLLAYVFCSYRDPRLRRRMADNDNLPERRNSRIFVHLLEKSVFTPRYAVALIAVMVQVLDPASPLLPQLVAMQLVCAASVALFAAIRLILPRRLLTPKRLARRVKTAPSKSQTVFISRRAVTAGYRKIAA